MSSQMVFGSKDFLNLKGRTMIFFHIIYKKLATIRRFFSNAKNFLLKVFLTKKMDGFQLERRLLNMKVSELHDIELKSDCLRN